MKREIITTGDGSKTIRITKWNEQYHSIHGAIQESEHVFIKQGLTFILNRLNIDELSILEYGFGTGLNTYLTALYCKQKNIHCSYTGLEAYPVEIEEINQLNYSQNTSEESKELFSELHNGPWEKKFELFPGFFLEKLKMRFEAVGFEKKFDLIYFDAFGARVQPELWTREIFEPAFKALKSKGCLVTYSSKGSVKRALQDCGFEIEKLDGPPGKRHMLRAVKGL